MHVRIAIAMPHSIDLEYGERAIPQYERAIAMAQAEPVRIPLDRPRAEVKKIVEDCNGVLLPGSKADVDPSKFRQARSPHAAETDPRREDMDFALLEDAYARHKPVLAICYGLQSLNVYRQGSLIQHIPDFLPEETRMKVNHEAGRKVAVAHTVAIDQDSKLAEILGSTNEGPKSRVRDPVILPVNSSHHQSADVIGSGLRIVGRCPDDGIIEALEGDSPDHFVLAVQWHPERSVDADEHSRAIFRALVAAAR